MGLARVGSDLMTGRLTVVGRAFRAALPPDAGRTVVRSLPVLPHASPDIAWTSLVFDRMPMAEHLGVGHRAQLALVAAGAVRPAGLLAEGPRSFATARPPAVRK
jgi:hypothetical protein